MLGEDRRDGPVALDDHGIGLDEATTQDGGKSRTHRRLPRPHEAGEHDVVFCDSASGHDDERTSPLGDHRRPTRSPDAEHLCHPFRRDRWTAVLQITEAELAEPGPGQALVGVHASGVNFIDTYHRSGLYPVDLPFIPGSEGAGIVEAVGADVTDVAVGDRVAWVGVPGSYAGRVLAPTEALMPIPDGVSLEIAAALPSKA